MKCYSFSFKTIFNSLCSTTSSSTCNHNEELVIKTNGRPTLSEVMAAIAVSLGSLIVGIASAYTSPATASMARPESTLHATAEEASWIGGLMPLGALCGGIFGGYLLEKLGRKTTILATAIPFIFSWLLIALASNIWMVYVSRAIVGMCIGIICLSFPVYLAETVQPEVRGTLGLLPTSFGNGGILICYIAGYFVEWRNLAYIGALLSLPFLVTMLLVPETPRWFIAHGQEEKGEKALQWFRGAGVDIRTELNQIKDANVAATKEQPKLKDLLQKRYVKPIIVSLGLMFLQQFSGINAVVFYAAIIFKSTGSDMDENLCSIIIGIVNMFAAFIALVLIDRLGRKVLLTASEVGMVFSLGTLGAYFLVKASNPTSVEGYSMIPIGGLIVFVLAFSLGFGPIPWLMLGEIFPSRIRGSAAAFATSFNWFCTFVVAKSFPEVMERFGIGYAFIGFGVICFCGIFFIIFYVPETRGQSLEDIEINLSGPVRRRTLEDIERNLARPIRRLSSLSNMKPFPMSIN